MTFKHVIWRTLAAFALLLILGGGWVFFEIRAADERLAQAIGDFEKARQPDKTEQQRLTQLEKECYNTALQESPASDRLADEKAVLKPAEIQSYSSLYSSCLAQDFLSNKRPLIEQARLYYSAALPARFFQHQRAPENKSFDLILPSIFEQQDKALARQMEQAKSFRPIADKACAGYWGIRACSLFMGGLPGTAMRERYVIDLIEEREKMEAYVWQMKYPAEAQGYSQWVDQAKAQGKVPPVPPWLKDIDTLEEHLKIMSQDTPKPAAQSQSKSATASQ